MLLSSRMVWYIAAASYSCVCWWCIEIWDDGSWRWQGVSVCLSPQQAKWTLAAAAALIIIISGGLDQTINQYRRLLLLQLHAGTVCLFIPRPMQKSDQMSHLVCQKRAIRYDGATCDPQAAANGDRPAHMLTQQQRAAHKYIFFLLFSFSVFFSLFHTERERVFCFFLADER